MPFRNLLAGEPASGSPGETKTGARDGTAKRRKRSAAGWATGSRSALIVPTKPGNSARADPVEESGAPDHGPAGRQHDGCIDIRDRVNETLADSVTGCPWHRIHDQRNRMRQSRTSGSVGAPGGQPPGATRPPFLRPPFSSPLSLTRCVLLDSARP